MKGEEAEAADRPNRGGLNDRVPGQAVIEKLLADREGEPPPSFLGRIFGADPLSPDNHPW
ncbi:hypothetical protein GCM10023063_25350 [Arthrobacter methylotrophus]|uniref:hypothetical protein n=1 Tax=Arthrobacter methylotrophus TaxID=121291 RepID=UPI0031F12EBF